MEYSSLILVVDDQSRGRQALAGLLEPEGYRLAFAASGPEALVLARLLAPDLVLLDVMMPEMDGFEVCRRLRADPALALVPVVMVTALDDTESLLQGLDAGADDFVTKPFHRVALRARVRTITRLNRFRVLLDGQRQVTTERAQLLWAIEHTTDGYLLLDEHGMLQYGNAQARLYLGLPPAPAPLPAESLVTLGHQRFQLVPAEAWAAWPQPAQATRYLVRLGGTTTLWLKVDLFDLPGGVLGSRLVHLQDVSAQVEAQQSLWTFHSFVSHKLRTPLTSLLGGMHLLMRRTQGLLPSDLTDLIEIAYGGAQRLKEVVNDVFHYLNVPVAAPPGAGCSLPQLPELVMRLAGELGIIDMCIAEATALDAQRLTIATDTVELLLTELLENARKFHPRQSPAVCVTLGIEGGAATIQVADDGLALAPEQLARLWEPYHQIDPECTGQVPGLGLGMATVARLVWSAGGTCRVTSRPDGPGLIVDLALPLEKGGAHAPGLMLIAPEVAAEVV